MNKKITLFLLALMSSSIIFAQNVGVGTANPQEKLHVANGTVRIDGMASAGAFNGIPLTNADRIVWVDALGTLHSLNNGGNGQILSINNSGIPVWVNPATPSTLTTGNIWIGDATNTPVEQPTSGDVIMSMTGVNTIQDNAVDGTDISITGEGNGSIMYFDGTDWVNLGIGAAGQTLVVSGTGIPSWINSNAALSTYDVVNATGGAVVVTNGTGQVVGGSNLALDVQDNTVSQKGLVTAPTAANPFKVWGTDASGNPDWRDPATVLAANAKDITAGAGNNAVSVTNGTGQLIGAANAVVNVASNGLGQDGVVTGTTAANGNQVWGTDASGNPAWVLPGTVLAANASDVTTTNPAITIGNGTNQVIGTTDMTIDVANNSATSAGLVTAGGANPNQVWGTNGAGVPAWTTANAALVTKDITTANPSITIGNGTGQTIGASNVTIDVANNALNVGGLVAAPTVANGNQVWGTDASGNPAWVLPGTVLAANASDVTTANPAITIGNGTNQVIGTTDMTIDVANNSATSAGLVTAGGANPNQVWGTNGAGVPAWTTANAALVTKDITAINPAITITNGTGQTIGAANVVVDVANNSVTSAGLVTAGGANPNQVWGTNGAGVPAWTSANAALVTKDITATNPAITITNGTGQTIGAANVVVDVANNSATSAGLVTAGGANPNQVWGTNGAGVPAWTTANAALVTKDITTANPSITIGNGTGQTIGASNVTIDVANNALNVGGLVAAPTVANGNQVWGTDASGNPAWVLPGTVLAANASDVTTANPAITIGNGTNQVIGTTDMTINVANNSATSAGLVTAGGANPNQVWGTNGAGVPAWTTANAALVTKDITATNPAITITNGTGQTIGAANVVVDVANNSATSAGLVSAGGANPNQVWGTNGAGVPAWTSANAALTTKNVVAGAANNAVSITNGTAQVIGATDVTVNVATNGLNQAGVVTGTTLANANQVWGTTAAGVPGWIAANSTITGQNVTGTGPITVTNGTGQVIGAAAMNISVATNALNQAGVVTGPTAAQGNMVWGTTAAGSPGWIDPSGLVDVDNGLYYNNVAGKVRQGGGLVENTTITGAGYNYTHDLTGLGDFIVTEASNAIPSLFVKGNDATVTDGYVGIGINTPANRLHINNTIVAGTTAGTIASYPFAIGFNSSVVDYTIGSNASFGFQQTWNSKPLLINSQGNFVGVNLTTAPIQNLDVNGRINVTNGVVQRGTTTITATNDLGLYSQTATNWIRIASNAGPIKFFTDQGGGNSAGTNATMAVDNANGGAVSIAAETNGTGNAGTAAASAVVDINSVTKGILFPRMTQTQRNAIASPVNGLHIYNTTENCLNYYVAAGCSGGFWQSYCCPVVEICLNASQNCVNVFSLFGSVAAPRCLKLTIGPGVVIGSCGGCAASSVNPALNCSGLPSGTQLMIVNNGEIRGRGGDGGAGGRESDGVCQGDIAPNGGCAGGDAVLGGAGVNITIVNNGTIAGGGGGGGGGGWGCCSAGGGGGGGGGVPAGVGGGGNCWSCVSGFVCGCGRSGCSGAGTGGSVTGAGGGGLNGNTGAGTGCPGTCTSGGGGNGGGGGAPGNNGAGGQNGGGGGGATGAATRQNGGTISTGGGTIQGPQI